MFLRVLKFLGTPIIKSEIPSRQIKTRYGANLENLKAGCTVGLLIDEESRLHLYINGIDQGIAAIDLPPYIYAVIDLYGQCEEISIIGSTGLEGTYTSNDTINMTIANTQDRGQEAELEDVENSREKADLECHEKENVENGTGAAGPLNLPLAIVNNSNQDANLTTAQEMLPTSSSPSHSNSNSNNSNLQLLSNLLENKAMSSSIQSDSNNSDTGSEMSNDPLRSGPLVGSSKLKNHPGSVMNQQHQSTNDSNTMSNNEMENDGSHRNECTNVEINNATNINIRNGSVATSSNMTNLNTAINSTNANNAINESIASNSQINNMTASNSSPNNLSSINILNCSQDNFTSQCHNIVNNMTASAPNNMTTSIASNNVSTGGADLQTSSNRQSALSNNCLASVVLPNEKIATNSSPSLVGSLRVSSLPSSPIGTGVTNLRKCEYLNACVRLKKSLVLPDEFFSLDEVICHCASCYKLEGDGAICNKGEPPAEFAIPVGWVRFPLRQSINANQIPQSTTDKWHVAFYGTRLDSIR